MGKFIKGLLILAACSVVTAGVCIATIGHAEAEEPCEHELVELAAVEPTCTAAGLTAGSKCSRCDVVFIEQKEIPALGHVEEELAAVEPTCTEEGLTAGSKCSRCGEILEAQKVIVALGHDVEEIAAKAPTCTSAGWTSGTQCKRCRTLLSGKDPIMALGHNETPYGGLSATCTTDGYTAGTWCSRCNTYTTGHATIPAKGHLLQEIPATEPTCAHVGWTSGTQCLTCKRWFEGHEEIQKLPHTIVEIPATDPTCQHVGYTRGKTCSVCHTVIEKREEIAVTDHEYVFLEEIPATHQSAGRTEGEWCRWCYRISWGLEEIPKIGHHEIEIPAVAPTCTETGLTAGVKCSGCDEILVAQEIVPALGHVEENVAATEPTCTNGGHGAGIKCSRCNKELYGFEHIEPLGHDSVVIPRVEPTCTETGLTAGRKCTRCNVILVAQEVIPATGHGSLEHIDAIPATCTETGMTEGYVCTVCRQVTSGCEPIPALGHSSEEIPAVAPTCTQTGLTAGGKCSRCEAILTAQEVVPALGHHGVDVAAESPTCTAAGHTAGVQCDRCNEMLEGYDTVAALGHIEAERYPEGEPAVSCEESGCGPETYCTRCNEIIHASEWLEALGHDYDISTTTCTRCGNVDSYGIVYENGIVRMSGSELSDRYNKLIIAPEVNGVATVGIAENGFQYASNLKEIVLPDSIESIGNNAFWGCSSLKALSNSADELFEGQIRLPANCKTVGSAAFMDCNLIDYIVLNSALTTIGEHAFASCQLNEVYIPQSVTSIGNAAFNAFGKVSLSIMFEIEESAKPSGISDTFVEKVASYEQDPEGYSRVSVYYGVDLFDQAAFEEVTEIMGISDGKYHVDGGIVSLMGFRDSLYVSPRYYGKTAIIGNAGFNGQFAYLGDGIENMTCLPCLGSNSNVNDVTIDINPNLKIWEWDKIAFIVPGSNNWEDTLYQGFLWGFGNPFDYTIVEKSYHNYCVQANANSTSDRILVMNPYNSPITLNVESGTFESSNFNYSLRFIYLASEVVITGANGINSPAGDLAVVAESADKLGQWVEGALGNILTFYVKSDDGYYDLHYINVFTEENPAMSCFSFPTPKLLWGKIRITEHCFDGLYISRFMGTTNFIQLGEGIAYVEQYAFKNCHNVDQILVGTNDTSAWDPLWNYGKDGDADVAYEVL